MKFLAIDFETANYSRNSACALGLVLVQDNKVVTKETYLIKPPQSQFVFTELHGISWNDVKDCDNFSGVWEKISHLFSGIDFLAAHNAPFDRGVLKACCETYGLEFPRVPFLCTVRVSRNYFKLKPANLAAVCRHFGISLKHHDASSDTDACAQILLRAMNEPAFDYRKYLRN